MSALASMKAVLSATGLYHFEDSPLLEAELSALGVGLEMAEMALAELMRESSTATAETWGLDLWEDAYGLDNHTLPILLRREALLSRGAARAATPTGLVAGMASLGLEAVLSENRPAGTVNLKCSPRVTDPMELKRLAICAGLLLPCHLSGYLDFGSVSWDTMDSEDVDWNTMDSRERDWEALDAMGGDPVPVV